MKTGDWIWTAALGCVMALFLNPASRDHIAALNHVHPVLMGFAKFAVLATMGELLAIRIGDGRWRAPIGLAYRAAVWGFVGVLVVISFTVFTTGVEIAIRNGLLPAAHRGMSTLARAAWTSIAINLSFAPFLMIGHRVADTYLDLAEGSLAGLRRVRLEQVIGRIDWQGLIRFVCLRTIPLFWMPAHTVTFLLPPQYRVIYAAFLSLLLGVILALGKRARQMSINSDRAVPVLLQGGRRATAIAVNGELAAGAD